MLGGSGVGGGVGGTAGVTASLVLPKRLMMGGVSTHFLLICLELTFSTSSQFFSTIFSSLLIPAFLSLPRSKAPPLSRVPSLICLIQYQILYRFTIFFLFFALSSCVSVSPEF